MGRIRPLELAVEYFQSVLKHQFNVEKNILETAEFLQKLLNSKKYGEYQQAIYYTVVLFDKLLLKIGMVGGKENIEEQKLEDIEEFLQILLNEKAGVM